MLAYSSLQGTTFRRGKKLQWSMQATCPKINREAYTTPSYMYNNTGRVE